MARPCARKGLWTRAGSPMRTKTAQMSLPEVGRAVPTRPPVRSMKPRAAGGGARLAKICLKRAAARDQSARFAHGDAEGEDVCMNAG